MLEIKGLKKAFGSLEVLKGVDLKVNQGDVVAILGLSLIHISEPTRPY